MPESTSDDATIKGDALPQVPECDVTQDDAGVYHLKHRGTGDTATAATSEQVEVQGIMLRTTAAWARQDRGELPFTVGDIP